MDIDVLDATGEPEKAQQIRWDCFENHLLRDRLRDYLKRLADFDDVIAEEKALTQSLTFPIWCRHWIFSSNGRRMSKAAKTHPPTPY
ncbi:hypothetical protein EOA24_39355 [Mesorhizobium sp. M2A.F.Ca.ET.039.01.1.1]|nr:hypothetical protein EOA24_39355 [Mesorhizobium sp. M2A.F.Ca.ET.039.01.1.1]